MLHLNTFTLNSQELSTNGYRLLFSHGIPAAFITRTQDAYKDANLYLRVPSSSRHVQEWFRALSIPDEKVKQISLEDMVRLWKQSI